eukprot:288914_1
MSFAFNKYDLLLSNFTKDIFIPTDILEIIKIYYIFYDLDPNSMLISVGIESMRLLNIFSQQTFERKVVHIDLELSDVINHRSYIPKYLCEISNDYLPQTIINLLTSCNNLSLTHKQITSNKWSMIIKYPRVIIFLESRYAYAYSFNLPGLSDNIVTQCSPIYDKSRKMLYYPYGKYDYSGFFGGIYSLSLDANINFMNDMRCGIHIKHTKQGTRPIRYTINHRKENILSWKWKTMSTNTKCVRPGASYCMIDNDYIGIMGGRLDLRNIDLTNFELHSIYCDTSIWLKNMNYARYAPLSLYHKQFYKVICGGDNEGKTGIEWYDINNNKWNMITYVLPGELSNAWISSFNPFVLFLVIEKSTDIPDIRRLDLRENNLQNGLVCIPIDNPFPYTLRRCHIY